MLSIEETKELSRINLEFAEARSNPARPVSSAEPTPLTRWPQIIKKDPEAPFLKAWDEATDLAAARALFQAFKEAAERSRPDPSTVAYTQEDTEIAARDGARITLRIHRPKTPPAGRPGMVMFHGGGFVVGNLEVNAGLAHTFAEMDGVAVDVDYRLAPEHPFPVPVHDCLDALRWVAAHAHELGIDPASGLLVAGESAGADIALAVAHAYRQGAREEGLLPLTGIYAPLTSAVTRDSVPEKYRDRFVSMEQNADAPVLSAESLAFIRKMYEPQPAHTLAEPLLLEHDGIPKTYFQACGWDPTRDCSLVAEQVFSDAGIPTRLDVYAGLSHTFWTVMPDAGFSKHRQEDVRLALRWLLES